MKDYELERLISRRKAEIEAAERERERKQKEEALKREREKEAYEAARLSLHRERTTLALRNIEEIERELGIQGMVNAVEKSIRNCGRVREVYVPPEDTYSWENYNVEVRHKIYTDRGKWKHVKGYIEAGVDPGSSHAVPEHWYREDNWFGICIRSSLSLKEPDLIEIHIKEGEDRWYKEPNSPEKASARGPKGFFIDSGRHLESLVCSCSSTNYDVYEIREQLREKIADRVVALKPK